MAVCFFILLSISLAHYYREASAILLVYDPDFKSENKWEIGFHNVDRARSWRKHIDDRVIIHVFDDLNNPDLSWGFIHQGQYPHGWGVYAAFEPPLKHELVLNPNSNFNLILELKLKRSEVEFFNGALPGWIERENHVAHVQIGLALFFEVEDRNYSAPTSIYDTNFQFEVTFLRMRLSRSGEVVYMGDLLKFRAPEYDNDTHNLFSIAQIEAGKWYVFKLDSAPYLKRAWSLCSDIFQNTTWIKLRWVNFYIEVLNAEIEVEVDYIKLTYKPEILSQSIILKSITSSTLITFTLIIACKIIGKVKKYFMHESL